MIYSNVQLGTALCLKIAFSGPFHGLGFSMASPGRGRRVSLRVPGPLETLETPPGFSWFDLRMSWDL